MGTIDFFWSCGPWDQIQAVGGETTKKQPNEGTKELKEQIWYFNLQIHTGSNFWRPHTMNIVAIVLDASGHKRGN